LILRRGRHATNICLLFYVENGQPTIQLSQCGRRRNTFTVIIWWELVGASDSPAGAATMFSNLLSDRDGLPCRDLVMFTREELDFN
jgi:hypothetical protein